MSAPRQMHRLDELLADRALWGLAEDEQHDLERTLAAVGAAAPDDSWDLAAGAATAALLGPRTDPTPEHLRVRLEADALSFFRQQRKFELRQVARALQNGNAHAPSGAPPHGSATAAHRSAPPGRWVTAPWLLAAAATLLAIVIGWDRFAPARTPTELRATLMTAAPDLVRLDWSAGPSELSGNPSGDVVWSDQAQQGFMTFRGLPRNDPAARQYQLWIFDQERSADRPVDGGVFDIPTDSGVVIVPIDAKIAVKKGFAFAITVEQPGGVVVSEREHIVAVAGL